MAFLKRLIDITIKLKPPETFGGELGDTMTLTGHRCGVYIAQAGGDSQGTLQCQIFGLPLEQLNRLTSIGPIATEHLGHKIQIAAGVQDEMHLVFTGTINSSWADLTNQPNAVLNIISTAAQDVALDSVGAISYKGDADVKDILDDIAKSAGLVLENKNNVSVILKNVYLPGSNLDKIKAVCRAARISYTIDKGVLAIWPNGLSRNNSDMFLLSPQTGMVGYPTFSSKGILVTCVYNPAIRLGDHIKVESQLTVANGIWIVNQVIHSLESENPDGSGAWFSTLYCSRSNL